MPKMPITFEELWVKCEDLQKEITAENSTSGILESIVMIINLYKTIDAKEIPNVDQQQIKSCTMGEILLALTAISLKDNINVYEALNTALQSRVKKH